MIFSKPKYEELSEVEWLVTNGIGGYAASSVCGANTRRYHGLLVASYNPPTDRRVLVSTVEEEVLLPEGTTWSFSSNQYKDVIHPEGYATLTEFTRTPLPVTTFSKDNCQIRKTVFMRYGKNVTVIEYENTGEKEMTLNLTPLFVSRDYHGLFHEDAAYDFYHEAAGENTRKIYPRYGSDPIYFRFSAGEFNSEHDWYHGFQYAKEEYRGLDFTEDAHCLGRLTLQLRPDQKSFLIFGTEGTEIVGNPAKWKDEEIKRLEAIGAPYTDDFVRDLVVSSDQFLVRRKESGQTIIAGYPWFTDWGRDTMIAMRGLTIATGKQELTESILRTFLDHLDGGMLPNRFPDRGEAPEYNTIDATLWLFVVLHEYYERFGNLDFIREVFPKLTEILGAHTTGARYGIHLTPEGLLFGGEGLAQLTWMDARVGDYVVTPRHGCPVEVNALWYNALEIYCAFHTLLGLKNENLYNGQAKKTKKAFRKYFLNEDGYLNDVVIPGNYVDEAIRPNQLYALSLPHPLLNRKESKQVLDLVERELYTDLGLRSLAPGHLDFRPDYGGDQWQRDTAYHQGTVWAFLWGEYALAYLNYYKFSAKAQKEIRGKAEGLRTHFYDQGCLHAIAEIFDGRRPEATRGCPQQAWSIGMPLRVFLDPKFK